MSQTSDNSNDSFIIREAQPSDTGAIISLLKACLGEKSVRKTNEYWNWKHFQNPFGNSYVLLAFAGETLVAVRAFIRWEWIRNSVKYKAVRAVDTVTHPEYRRKGLFKRLTFELLDQMKADGVSFIYNTPNENSRPGNLKMGWKEFVRIRLKVRVSLTYLLRNRLKRHASNFGQILNVHSIRNIDEVQLDSILAEHHRNDVDKFKTNFSKDYFFWRYLAVPVCDYGAITSKFGHFLLIFRLKKRGTLRELRITDILTIKSQSLDADINKSIDQLIKYYEADLVTLTGEAGHVFSTYSKKWQFIDVGRRGLMVTLNGLNIAENEIFDKKRWAWTTGDLELF